MDQIKIKEKSITPSQGFLNRYNLIIASNRGPVSFKRDKSNQLNFQRSSGGLVTALSGVSDNTELIWIACAKTEEDREWQSGVVNAFGEETQPSIIEFLSPTEESYNGYYNVIANPLLWFLQHSMWDVPRSPIINLSTWQAWENGYVPVNHLFAKAIAQRVITSQKPSLVMLQDYHLYLTPRRLRNSLRPHQRPFVSHFIHIPWPGPEYWGILPQNMRQRILDSLCAVDLLGFQTEMDGWNFLRTVEGHLPKGKVNFKKGRVWYRNHATYIRDFPISIDVDALKNTAQTPEVLHEMMEIQKTLKLEQCILRVDRLEPSKNIIRGFIAFEELLQLYPNHQGRVKFLALLVPSRLDVIEYQDYLDEVMAAAGRINAQYGSKEWEPVRVMVAQNYTRAVAAMKLYDVLLVNPIADGMNLVAKEGPIVNMKNGLLILSEKAGASQQLAPGAIIISPCDVYATALALHEALLMPAEERSQKAEQLRTIIENADINKWFDDQLSAIREILEKETV
jgi:trehalose 6-phosphate synthase